MIEFGTRVENVSYVERPGAYAIIRNDVGEVAVLHTQNGVFLPGGGVEPGEEFEEALRREILEELGYGVNIAAKIGSAAQYLYSKVAGKHFKKIGHFYRAALTEKITDAIHPDHQLLWRSPEDGAKLLSQEFQSWAVGQAIDI
ncbi:MAG: pyrophosphohydrolase including oxidative damage repair enzyme [Acidobacteriales bacterium]|nr:pyrophosphohydrolase including oxidative damage repair enzyme [Terriglobales bacterium]